MPIGEQFRSLLGLVSGCLETCGYWLLTLNQAVAVALRGRSACPEISPRLVGAMATFGSALAVAAVLMAASWGGVRAHDVSSDGDIERGAGEPEFIVHCERCGWERAVGRSELCDVRDHNGVYYCDECKAYSAYVEHVGNTCVVTRPSKRDYP